jgi:hypothetical protein
LRFEIDLLTSHFVCQTVKRISIILGSVATCLYERRECCIPVRSG